MLRLRNVQISAAVVLLCSVVPGAANEDDKGRAAFVMFLRQGLTASDCPVIVHTERVGTERALVATCSNKEAYLIFEDREAAISCTSLTENKGVLTSPCHKRRRLPNIIRGPSGN